MVAMVMYACYAGKHAVMHQLEHYTPHRGFMTYFVMVAIATGISFPHPYCGDISSPLVCDNKELVLPCDTLLQYLCFEPYG